MIEFEKYKLNKIAVAIAISMIALIPVCSGSVEKATKPKIEKLGTIDINLVETTPIVFKGKVYRFEYVRKNYWNNTTGDSYFRFVDHQTGKPGPAFAKGHHLGSAFVDNDTVYVTGVTIWDASGIDMFVSKDIVNWEHRKVMDRPGLGVFNTSVCKADDNYVLMYEIGKPAELAGNRFTALFAKSKDMINWQLMPPECNYSKDRYTAPHCLRYLNGWFYNFYLEAHNGYEMRVVRSKDLIKWHSSPLNPVISFSEKDKQIANNSFSKQQREEIATARNINNSDIDFCEYKGRLIINYSWGNQAGKEFLAEAIFNGSEKQFLSGWFPEKKAESGNQYRKVNFSLSCNADNDLYSVLKQNGISCTRYDTAFEAIENSPAGGGVLILAGGYPDKTTDLSEKALRLTKTKQLRLYVEFPSSLGDIEIGEPKDIQHERGVITSNFFGNDLDPMRILMIHNCRYVPVKAESPHIVLAKVAGFDTAVFGLNDTTPKPLLFEHTNNRVLVSTTKLSHFITARYMPSDAYEIIWKKILSWLLADIRIDKLKWTPDVSPAFTCDEQLPDSAAMDAIRRGVDWYGNARFLLHPDWQNKMDKWGKRYPFMGPRPAADLPVGDGSLGLLEGFSSKINLDGSQNIRWWRRADCNSEGAMAYALRGQLDDDNKSKLIASNLLNYVFNNSNMQQGSRNDPKSPSYGLVSWATTHAGVYYGDDNARVILSALAASAALQQDTWDPEIVRCILANFRTTGKRGFRMPSLPEANLQQYGWQHYYNSNIINYWPHMECWIWATYLWLYDKTDYQPLLDRTKSAIAMMMNAYPDNWTWTNGFQQERARMLLPLAWLVRVDDTEQHRKWLLQVGYDMLEYQLESGGIREQIGELSKGRMRPPVSNSEYPRSEASLIQQNGDAVADMLYTCNFALLSLTEAAQASGDEKLNKAADNLADFLIRIQMRSENHPELDGAWYRGFDLNRWEPWASNADYEWGPWCTETGWTQGWIVSMLALREMDQSLWDITENSKIAEHFQKYRDLMLSEEAINAVKTPQIAHDAIGKTVILVNQPSTRYPGISGPQTIADGFLAPDEYNDFHWLGFDGTDLDAQIDLEGTKEIKTVSVEFLQAVTVGIFLPEVCEISVSDDGITYRKIALIKHDVSVKTPGPVKHRMTADGLDTKARFIRVKATNIKKIPNWHDAKGKKAWLFVDEIIINPPN